jgi:hypothetical protein
VGTVSHPSNNALTASNITVDNITIDGNDISSTNSDGDILFKGNDGGSTITALTLDMSDAGNATFNKNADFGDGSGIRCGASQDLQIYHENGASNKIYGATANHIDIHTSDVSTPRIRVKDDGNILIGTTSTTPSPGVTLLPAGTVGIGNSSGNSGVSFIEFRRSGTQIGSVVQNGTTGVTYNTSSDYRLKENVKYDFDATSRLKQLKPARFNFTADKDITVDGFIAHEVSSIVPEAITGEKDGTEKYLDDNGKEQTRPFYQGIDQSKLVPLLVKSLQEAIAEIDTLKTKVTALENA